MTTSTTSTANPARTRTAHGTRTAPGTGPRPGIDTSKFESLSGAADLDFPEYDAPPAEPMGLVWQWLAEAVRHGVREPRSMALATATADGRASNRIVTITRESANGLVFTTHSTSRKGRELAATGWASALLYWRETGQQIMLAGPVTPLPPAESDALWTARPVPLHSMTAASRQSEPIEDLESLRDEAYRLLATGQPLPRPERFTGYLLEPAEVEFWSAASDRLHRRLSYTRDGGRWRTARLQP
ncbi:phenazine biosynthesis FMN-dependent oxidase PhzG [Streptomyces antimicrobicus]|uniref:Phenazine biosynthesis FMN-dependent oxidase PhzG n=1 Tax=Streptomyces antimicrobicus TaxID=2883108 RepID=A0ABS8B7R1_9ACTN|nr:phenazine biosynthesis FMN-dependent oxidase PhzG [Streptomyces antimicrobicus]MCB5180579.1 phenazine biosynthesis FMN-dependent oxidase PhzG [Streptomyces antimicrobicus]